jgi:hypothetical protein
MRNECAFHPSVCSQGVADGTTKPWHSLIPKPLPPVNVDSTGTLNAASGGLRRATGVFGPLAFLDVVGQEAVPPSGASIHNASEASMVVCLYRELAQRWAGGALLWSLAAQG